MKTVATLMLVLAVLLFPPVLLADECLEGDCYNGIGKGFTDAGEIYAGEWLKGEPHGQGRLYVAKDEIVEGRWQNGILIEEKKQK